MLERCATGGSRYCARAWGSLYQPIIALRDAEVLGDLTDEVYLAWDHPICKVLQNIAKLGRRPAPVRVYIALRQTFKAVPNQLLDRMLRMERQENLQRMQIGVGPAADAGREEERSRPALRALARV